MLDGSDVKAMPGWIITPNSGSLYKKKKNTGSQMGYTKKIFLKNNCKHTFLQKKVHSKCW